MWKWSFSCKSQARALGQEPTVPPPVAGVAGSREGGHQSEGQRARSCGAVTPQTPAQTRAASQVGGGWGAGAGGTSVLKPRWLSQLALGLSGRRGATSDRMPGRSGTEPSLSLVKIKARNVPSAASLLLTFHLKIRGISYPANKFHLLLKLNTIYACVCVWQ